MADERDSREFNAMRLACVSFVGETDRVRGIGVVVTCRLDGVISRGDLGGRVVSNSGSLSLSSNSEIVMVGVGMVLLRTGILRRPTTRRGADSEGIGGALCVTVSFRETC